MRLSTVISQIWTIARHSVMQAVRMRVVIVLIAFLLVLCPALPFLLKSDQTHAGQVKMVITYSIYLTSFLLSVLTVFISSITLNTEIKQQQIFLLDPKPVPRSVMLAGKWLGVMIINFALLVLMLGVTYGIVRYQSRQLKGETDDQYRLFLTQVTTARAVLHPPQPNLDNLVEQELQRMKKENRLPEVGTEDYYRGKLKEFFSRSALVVEPGSTGSWVVSGIPMSYAKQKDAYITVRFRHYGSSDATTKEIPGFFEFNTHGGARVELNGTFMVNRPHEFAVAGVAVVPDEKNPAIGRVEINYTNLDDEGVAAIFPFDVGIEVMYPAAGFAQNIGRAGVMILIKLAFIAIVGLFGSTFLSFPVAVLLTLSVLITGHVSDFIVNDVLKTFALFGPDAVAPGMPIAFGDQVARAVISNFLSIFPNFTPFDIVPYISEGKLIPLGLIASGTFWILCVRGLVLAGIGWYVFRRRELAALTAST